MIKANELRIGNWIYIDNGEKPKYAYDISAHDIEEIEGYGEDAFPIPLTPEILEKCKLDGYMVQVITYPVEIHGDIVKPPKTRIVFDGRELYVRIEYVHQLQNLYFALTGEELEIKL